VSSAGSERPMTLDYEDADGLWEAWAPAGEDDILARAAFDRALRAAAGLEEEGLYFRPGGWSVDLPVTAARVAVAAAVLGAGFQIAGLEDLDREIIIAAAGFVASMDVRPVRLGRQERRLADRLAGEGMVGMPVTAGRARRALPKKHRRKVGRDQVAEALDSLVAAGLADRHGDDEWVLRAKGSEAWLRFSLRGTDA
jgi:hypothetical protein